MYTVTVTPTFPFAGDRISLLILWYLEICFNRDIFEMRAIIGINSLKLVVVDECNERGHG